MEGINKNYLKSSSLISKFDKNKNQTPNSIEIGYRVNMSVLPSTNLIFRFSQDACRTRLRSFRLRPAWLSNQAQAAFATWAERCGGLFLVEKVRNSVES